MKKNIKELENLDLDEMIQEVENHAVAVENNFIKMFSEEPEESQRIPVFDFELN